MATKTFPKSELKDLVDGSATDGLTKVSDTITGKSRWSVDYVLVFRENATGKHYEVAYSMGATESQDESPFEYEPDDVECHEVAPVEKTVIVYERVP